LPGVGTLNLDVRGGAAAVAVWLREEMQSAGIATALCMGSWQTGDADPLGILATLDVARRVPGLFAIGVADPTRTDPDHLRRVEEQLAAGQVKALKAYLGYLHYPPDHPGYRPYFELAERFKLPVIFHTGDTYSPRAKVRFAHPLLVDDVAVDHPNVRFVLAHLGNPWLLDAAEVVYKNVNVWADLSALVIGNAELFSGQDSEDLLDEVAGNVRTALRYAERPNRFLYGSDWPLVPMAPYREFIRKMIPVTYQEMIFEENARRLFGL
jgi:predicted TIM-barrel fold metal-dependent hydrolase